MTGKDLFDAINNVNDEYLDEVTAEIAQENEQKSAGENSTKVTGLRISNMPAWSAVAAVMVILFVIVAALNLRNRKSGDPAKTSENEATVTATPTETVTATPVPDEEINSVGVRNRQLVCGWNCAVDIQADGTVRITALPELERIADLSMFNPRVDMRKDIVSLRVGFEMLYAVDRNGKLWTVSVHRDYIRGLSKENSSESTPVSIATWITALPVVEEFIEENKLIDGEYLCPLRSGRNIFLKESGELVEFVFEDSDIPTLRTVDEKVVSFEGHFYLKEDGTVGTFLNPKDLSVGMNSILMETGICELAENGIGVFGLRKNGTVACCVNPRYSCEEIVGSWRGVCGIAAEGSTGESCVAVIAAVHTDGTVSAVGVRETGSKEIEEVKAWKNVVAVAVGYNGRFIAGKTADGEILFAVLEGDPVRNELLACSRARLYSKCMNIATPEQKAQLEAIQDDLIQNDLYLGGGKEDYTRRILTIMGVIPEDAPRLTLEDAKRLIEEMRAEGLLDEFFSHINQIRERFNTVAIAPDEDGGSGFTIITYVLDPEKKTYIQIHSGAGIIYYNGTEQIMLFRLENYEIIDMGDSEISEKYFPNDYTGWRYPVLPRMSTWPYGDVAAMIDACKIPEDVVSAMATSDLIQSVLLYPMLFNAGLYSTDEMGYQHVKSWCSALQELATREDRYGKLLTVMDEHGEWFLPSSDGDGESDDSVAPNIAAALLILERNEDFSEIQQQIEDKLSEINKSRSKTD